MFNLLESDSSVSVPRARRRLSYRKQTQKLTENSNLNSNREDKGKQYSDVFGNQKKKIIPAFQFPP